MYQLTYCFVLKVPSHTFTFIKYVETLIEQLKPDATNGNKKKSFIVLKA